MDLIGEQGKRLDKPRDCPDSLYDVMMHCWDLSWVFITSLTQPAFLPRDAMLAQYMLSSCVCLFVRLSVCHKPTLYQNG